MNARKHAAAFKRRRRFWDGSISCFARILEDLSRPKDEFERMVTQLIRDVPEASDLIPSSSLDHFLIACPSLNRDDYQVFVRFRFVNNDFVAVSYERRYLSPVEVRIESEVMESRPVHAYPHLVRFVRQLLSECRDSLQAGMQ